MHNLFLSMLWVASAALSLPAAAPAPDGPETTKIIYPKEIENCEPCKRLWLVNNRKPKKEAKTRE